MFHKELHRRRFDNHICPSSESEYIRQRRSFELNIELFIFAAQKSDSILSF